MSTVGLSTFWCHSAHSSNLIGFGQQGCRWTFKTKSNWWKMPSKLEVAPLNVWLGLAWISNGYPRSLLLGDAVLWTYVLKTLLFNVHYYYCFFFLFCDILLSLFCCVLVFLLLNLIIIVFLFFCVCDILCIVQRRYPGIMYGTRVERTARDKQTNSCTCRIPPRLLVKYPDKVKKQTNRQTEHNPIPPL